MTFTEGYKMTEEHKQKIAKAILGIKRSPETCRKISEAKRGCKGSYGMLGKKMSDEHKAKISLAIKGKKKPPRTEEHKRKIGEAHKGKKMPESFKELMRVKMKGNKHAKGFTPTEHQIRLLIEGNRKRCGPNNPRWKGGLKREHEEQYGGIRYKIWRTTIFERDNFTCKKCLTKGGRLVSHHIYRWADYPEKRFDVSNGITLCDECHKPTIQHEKEYQEEFVRLLGGVESLIIFAPQQPDTMILGRTLNKILTK